MKRLTHIVLPIMEMTDKTGDYVSSRVREMLDVMRLSPQDFHHCPTDSGVEITGSSRDYGMGQKSLQNITAQLEALEKVKEIAIYLHNCMNNK